MGSMSPSKTCPDTPAGLTPAAASAGLFLAVAMLTRTGRLLMMCPAISDNARSRSDSLPNRTNPYPFDLAVIGSVMTYRPQPEVSARCMCWFHMRKGRHTARNLSMDMIRMHAQREIPLRCGRWGNTA